MIRKLLAMLASELAHDAMNRAETSVFMSEFIRHRGRSRFWSDVEHSLLGLGTFRENRGRRRKIIAERLQRRARPIAPIARYAIGEPVQ